LKAVVVTPHYPISDTALETLKIQIEAWLIESGFEPDELDVNTIGCEFTSSR